MWVLIIISFADTGQYVVTQEFSSMFKCQTAAQLTKDNSRNQGNPSWSNRGLVSAFCVEK